MTMTQIATNTQTLLADMNIGSTVIVFSIFACLLSLLVMFRSHKKNQCMYKKLSRLEHDLRIANSSAIAMGQQLISLEKQFKQQRNPDVESQLQQAVPVVKQSSMIKPSNNNSAYADDLNANESATFSVYDDARQSLAQGLSVSDVAKQCGLSHAEVSLLKALSRQTINSH